MNQFYEYVKSIITVAVCCFFCTFTTKLLSNSSCARGLKFVTGLCVFTVIISPVFSLLGKDNSFDISSFQTKEQYTESYSFSELTKQQTEKELTSKIITDTGIIPRDVSIEILCENNEIAIKSISISVNSHEDKNALYDYLKPFEEVNTTIIITVKNQ